MYLFLKYMNLHDVAFLLAAKERHKGFNPKTVSVAF